MHYANELTQLDKSAMYLCKNHRLAGGKVATGSEGHASVTGLIVSSITKLASHLTTTPLPFCRRYLPNVHIWFLA